MDLAIIRELFTRTIEAAEILGRDAALRKELAGKLAKLAPYRIGARGQLQEWHEDYPESEPKHRHLSHLYGFHPGNQIDPEAHARAVPGGGPHAGAARATRPPAGRWAGR